MGEYKKRDKCSLTLAMPGLVINNAAIGLISRGKERRGLRFTHVQSTIEMQDANIIPQIKCAFGTNSRNLIVIFLLKQFTIVEKDII